ncbi:MAG: hypothetical protein O2794_01325 [bacterium]|nr:hypothetical protein [bacterium]
MKVSLTTFLLMHKLVTQVNEHTELLIHELSHVPKLKGTSKESSLIEHIANEIALVYRYLGGLKFLTVELGKSGDGALLLIARDQPLYFDSETFDEVVLLEEATLRALLKTGQAFVAFQKGELDFDATALQAHETSKGVCTISELYHALYVANRPDSANGSSNS